MRPLFRSGFIPDIAYVKRHRPYNWRAAQSGPFNTWLPVLFGFGDILKSASIADLRALGAPYLAHFFGQSP